MPRCQTLLAGCTRGLSHALDTAQAAWPQGSTSSISTHFRFVHRQPRRTTPPRDGRRLRRGFSRHRAAMSRTRSRGALSPFRHTRFSSMLTYGQPGGPPVHGRRRTLTDTTPTLTRAPPGTNWDEQLRRRHEARSYPQRGMTAFPQVRRGGGGIRGRRPRSARPAARSRHPPDLNPRWTCAHSRFRELHPNPSWSSGTSVSCRFTTEQTAPDIGGRRHMRRELRRTICNTNL